MLARYKRKKKRQLEKNQKVLWTSDCTQFLIFLGKRRELNPRILESQSSALTVWLRLPNENFQSELL